MTTWTLAEHGDGNEKEWGSKIEPTFPRYEQLWREHVVPLTFRVLNPENLYMRPSLKPHLRRLGTAHYWMYYGLAGCHALLADRDFPSVGRLYDFYARLKSVADPRNGMLLQFLRAVQAVREHYGEPPGPRKRPLARYPDSVVAAIEDADRRVNDYRQWLQHNAGVPILNGYIPRDPKNTRYDLATIAETLDLPLRELTARFVEARAQAAGDLETVERALDGLWEIVLGDLGAIQKDRPQYLKDREPAEADRRLAFDPRLVPLRPAGSSPEYLLPSGVKPSIESVLSSLQSHRS